MIIVMLMCSSITLGITIFLLLENKVLVSVIEFYFDSSYKITLQLNSGFRCALSLCVFLQKWGEQIWWWPTQVLPPDPRKLHYRNKSQANGSNHPSNDLLKFLWVGMEQTLTVFKQGATQSNLRWLSHCHMTCPSMKSQTQEKQAKPYKECEPFLTKLNWTLTLIQPSQLKRLHKLLHNA